MNIKLQSLSVELIFLSVETENLHLRVRVPVPDYRRLHFTAESDAGRHVHAHARFAWLKIAPSGQVCSINALDKRDCAPKLCAKFASITVCHQARSLPTPLCIMVVLNGS